MKRFQYLLVSAELLLQ